MRKVKTWLELVSAKKGASSVFNQTCTQTEQVLSTQLEEVLITQLEGQVVWVPSQTVLWSCYLVRLSGAEYPVRQSDDLYISLDGLVV